MKWLPLLGIRWRTRTQWLIARNSAWLHGEAQSRPIPPLLASATVPLAPGLAPPLGKPRQEEGQGHPSQNQQTGEAAEAAEDRVPATAGEQKQECRYSRGDGDD